MSEKDQSVVFEADIPAQVGRGSATMTVVLTKTEIQDDPYPEPFESASISSSRTTSSNTLQVPDFDTFEPRRGSLPSNQDSIMSTSLPDRRLSAPNARRSSWGPIWEMRKHFLAHRRRLSSASSGDYHSYPVSTLGEIQNVYVICVSTKSICFIICKHGNN